MAKPVIPLWLFTVIALAGCTGRIAAGSDDAPRRPGQAGAAGADGDSNDPNAQAGNGAGAGGAGATSGDGDDPGLDPELDCDTAIQDPGPAPLRLLTREQYLTTVRDLFGDVPGLQEALGPATEASAYGLLQPDVSQVELESFQKAAELIAAHATQGDLDAIAPCAEDAAPESCARDMIERFGARVYRAPLAETNDVDRHVALFRAGFGAEGSAQSYAHGIEILLRGMLQAPRFLYQVELGTDEAVSARAMKLSPHELASRLSYLAWGAPPDAALIDAAQAGAFDTQAGVDEQLTRLLGDPRGSTLLRRFLEGWVHVNALDSVVKDAELYPEWEEPALREAMQAQARSFFDHVLTEEGGTLSALLTSRTVLVNDALADFYDLDTSASGDFEPLQLAAERASGVLTLPALLARLSKPDESSPIYRGKFVREMLLCQQLPSPPANIPPAPEVEAGVSTRERLSQHETDKACSGCHQLLDPIGFAFERFDAIGRYRTMDGGEQVDTSGALHVTRDVDGELDGIAELGARLAQSAEVEECMARQWFRYALNRFERDVDACTMQRLLKAFHDSGQDLNALPRAVIATDAFLYREPIETEESP